MIGNQLEDKELVTVTGGRVSQGPPQTDPQLLQAITQLAQTVKEVGSGIAQSAQQGQQGMMQMMQQMAQAKHGGGGAPPGGGH